MYPTSRSCAIDKGKVLTGVGVVPHHIKENDIKMIISINESRAVEVAQYANRLDQIKEHKCKVYAKEYDKMLSNFRKMAKHPDDEVLIYTEHNEILGVLALSVEPEEKYIEAVDGVYANKNYQEIAMEFFKYFKEKYAGFHFDAVYPLENKQAICFMQSIGAECVDTYMNMKLKKNDFHPSKGSKQVIPISEKYYESFCRLHDEYHPDVYWTGKRILAALDKYDVLIAVEKDELIGFVVTSIIRDGKAEVSFVGTDKRYRRQGYARNLLGEAIDRAFLSGANELILEVEVENIPAIHLYEYFGFQNIDTTSVYSIESL